MDAAAAELERNPVSKHHVQPEYGDEHIMLTRDGTAEPVQLTTSSIGNLTRLYHTLAI